MLTDTPSAVRLPVRRADLHLVPWGNDGAGVVKTKETSEYFKLGPIEFFLLAQLDGQRDVTQIAAAYQEKFGEPLPSDLLPEYIDFAREKGWLATDGNAPPVPVAPVGQVAEAGLAGSTSKPQAAAGGPGGQSPLFFRFKLYDPEHTLTAMEPWLRWVWTWWFLALSSCGIVAAGFVLWSNLAAFHSDFAEALNWQTLIIVGLTLITVTIFHEYAHGLTCKHYGGEVHEMGFLMMMGMPCLYANVSDAWLFPEKWKRMAVTLAGAYFDLCLWAVAVAVWRISASESLLNYVATVVIPVVGLRCFVNLSPLFKLDGYYLLTDWLGVPNLYQRGRAAFQEKARGLLWGETVPQPSDGRLAIYGLLSWGMSCSMMFGLGLAIYRLLGTQWAGAGIAGALFVGLASRQVVSAIAPSGVTQAMTPAPAPAPPSRFRGLSRVAIGLALVAGLMFVPVPDLIHGSFELRPSLRLQVRAPAAGFLRKLNTEEGASVSAGSVLAVLEIPDLETRLAQKRAELEEGSARLALLKVGPRHEELEWQQRKVDSSQARVETAKQRVERGGREEAEEGRRLAQKVTQHAAEAEAARDALRRATALSRSGVLSSESLLETEKRQQSMEARLGQTKAEQEAHKVSAGRLAEEELALRQQELREAEAELTYVKAGSRPEEIDAEQARIARIKEELRYLVELKSRLQIPVPTKGIVTTPHLKEKIGQYVREGDVICEVEDTAHFEAEILVSEDDLARVRLNQPLRIKVRAMPWDAFDTKILRIAPRASRLDAHSRAVLACQVDDPHGRLRSGMTGSARIDAGWKALGPLLLDRSTRFLKNEFWWW